MKILGIDLETTGLKENDRIIEYCGIMLDSGKVSDITMRFNPQMPIDPAASAVHHIKNEDLFDEPIFKDFAQQIHDQIKGADIVVIHNAAFDAPFLMREFRRIGIKADDLTVPTFCTKENGRFATFGGKWPKLGELCDALDIEYDTEKAHGAKYDVAVMLKCFIVLKTLGYVTDPVSLSIPFCEVKSD